VPFLRNFPNITERGNASTVSRQHVQTAQVAQDNSFFFQSRDQQLLIFLAIIGLVALFFLAWMEAKTGNPGEVARGLCHTSAAVGFICGIGFCRVRRPVRQLKNHHRLKLITGELQQLNRRRATANNLARAKPISRDRCRSTTLFGVAQRGYDSWVVYAVGQKNHNRPSRHTANAPTRAARTNKTFPSDFRHKSRHERQLAPASLSSLENPIATRLDSRAAWRGSTKPCSARKSPGLIRFRKIAMPV